MTGRSATTGVIVLIAGVALGFWLGRALPPSLGEILPKDELLGWRGSYYPDLLFLGEPEHRVDPNLTFTWYEGKAWPDGPADRFSVRWDTCLVLPQAQMLDIRVGSDDGARVFVDGEQVVDNWGDHGFRWREGARRLEAGVHHVQVEYYEKAGNARVELRLELPGQRQRTVPLAWLKVPIFPHDHPQVCEKHAPNRGG